MILLEHIAKGRLAEYGLPIPKGALARSAREAGEIAKALGGPMVIKAQVPTGGRGRAGGIKMARNPQEAEALAAGLMGKELLGHPVRGVLVEERLEMSQELYLSLAIDLSAGSGLLLFSRMGGVEVEELAEEHPGELHKLLVASYPGLREHVGTWLEGIGLEAELSQSLRRIISRSYRAFEELDLLLLETNPLAVLPGGKLVAADCKMELDDNSLFRHPELKELKWEFMSEREREAFSIGVSYVEMEGDVALIASGAGLGMASLDMMRQAGMRPANFLDTGGSISQELMEKAVKFVLAPKRIEGVLINLYGGINPMVEAAEGITAALAQMEQSRPMVVKLVGNRQEEAWEILEGQGIPVVKTVHTEEAAQLLARMLERTS